MLPNTPLIVTIDGPTASGKTTVAQAIAQRFGLFHLRGGTFLRAFAYFVQKSGVDPNNPEQLALLLEKFHLEIVEHAEDTDYLIYVNGEPAQNYLWTPEVDAIVSNTSRPPLVRAARVAWKRFFAIGKRLIADGRTLGSEVFPWADVKIHLTASAEQRAKRRYAQYMLIGATPYTLADIRYRIENRDASDAQGDLDRTRIYSDQHVIDSTDKLTSEIVEQISLLIESIGRVSQ